MTPAPVGLRCPEHSGKPQGAQRVTQSMRRVSVQGGGAIVTKALIAINVGVWLAMLATGSSISSSAGTIFEKGALFASAIDSQGHLVGVAHGEWYRLVTAMFLHASLLHIAFNMLALWWVGCAARAADRARPLPARLLRLRPGRLGGRALPGAVLTDGRRVGCDLRALRRDPRPRAEGELRARRERPRPDPDQPRVQLHDSRDLLGRPRRRADRRDALHAGPDPLRPRARRLRAGRARRRGRGGRRGRAQRARRVLESARLHLIEAAADSGWLTDLVRDSAVTYPVVAAAAALDAILPIVPSETIVITASVLAAHGHLWIWLIVPLAALGAFIGDNVSYALGHFFGDPIAARLFRSESGQRRLEWARAALDRRGATIIVVARFVPGGRTAVDVRRRDTRVPVAAIRALRRPGGADLGHLRRDAGLHRRIGVRALDLEGAPTGLRARRGDRARPRAFQAPERASGRTRTRALISRAARRS